jgi:hypothetical protein
MLYSRNACYGTVQNLCSSSLLSENDNFELVTLYKTRTSTVVLYGYKTLPLMLREEHRLRGFQKKVLRKIFGPKRKLKKNHNEKLHNLCSSLILIMMKSRRMR